MLSVSDYVPITGLNAVQLADHEAERKPLAISHNFDKLDTFFPPFNQRSFSFIRNIRLRISLTSNLLGGSILGNT